MTRIAAPVCYKWCTELAGEYLYAEVRRAGGDVWRRHANYGCRIEYEPGKDGRREDVLNYVIGKKERLHPDAERDRIEERKRLADSGQPSREELLRRAKAGRNDPNNQGYIAARILSGEYSMQYRHNKYVQHCKGTNLYEQVTRARGKPQSYLTISEEEAQQIVWKYAGTGVVRTVSGDKAPNVEFITVDRPVGMHPVGNTFEPSARVQIVYAKDGAHLFPVGEKND